MNYTDLLKDPRWQRKRLEVLQRENFTCEECFSTDKTLHVHHVRYIKGRKPWEYEGKDLRCLCVDCHAETTSLAARLRAAVEALDDCGKMQLLGYAKGYAWDWEDDDIRDVQTSSEVEGFVGYFAAFGVDVRRAVNGVTRTLYARGDRVIESDVVKMIVREVQSSPESAAA